MNTDYRGLIRQASIILFVVLAVYLALVRPLARQGVNLLENQIEEAVFQLEKYIPEQDQGILATKESVGALKSHLGRDKNNYQVLKRFVDPDKGYLPGSTEDAGLYFIEQLQTTSKRLGRQAKALKISIPESFGFSEEMPAQKENIEILLKELDAIDRVTTLMLEQKVEKIFLVKSLGTAEQRDLATQKLFYRELPIQLSFLCDSSTLIKFLYQIKRFSPALIVKDIVVKRQEGPSLEVQMLLSRLVIS